MTEPRVVRPDGVRFLAGAAWLGAAAASVWFCINLPFVEDRAVLWAENEVDPVRRRMLVVSMIVVALLPALLAGVTVPRRSLASVADDVERWSYRLAPLVLLAPIAPLIDRASFIGRPITVLSYMLLIGLAAAALGTRCLERGFSKEPVRSAKPSGAFVPAALTATVCVALFAHFAFYALLRHQQMRSMAYDLGIFDNMMWHLMHGDGFASTPTFGPGGGNHLHRHTTFGAPLLLPFYAIWPRAETLLVLQAAFSASTVIPIFLLGRRLLCSAWLGFVFALCYALYAPTHGANFYDFHFLTAAAPLFAWVFYLLFTEHSRALVIMTALTLAWREDTGVVLAFAGIAVWFAGVHPARTIKFVIACGVYFVLVKFVLMPLGGSYTSFADYYSHLQAPGAPGVWAVFETVATNPFYVFDEVFGPERLRYVLLLFVPLLFFPLRDRTAWVALIPAAGFTLLGSKDPLYSIYFQYTVYWAPAAFLCMFIVLRRRFVETGRRRALAANAAAILLATLLTSFYFGSVFKSPKMRGGFVAVSYEWTDKDEERLEAFRELASQIPPDASVAATNQECPHLSNRRNAYALRGGYYDADFLIVRLKHAKKKRDVGKVYREAVASGEYEHVDTKKGFALWKRKATDEEAL